MNFAERVLRLLEWQPQAIDIRDAGHCHCKANRSMLFYSLPSMDRTCKYITSKYHNPNYAQDEQGRWIDPTRIVGGFYCTKCGFSNAGVMRLDDYEKSEVYRKDEKT